MMSHGGLTKLVEECGELVQIAAKKINFPDTDNHPDGFRSMKARLEEEIADVFGAAWFVFDRLDLDRDKIYARAGVKLQQFKIWDAESEEGRPR